MATRTGTCRWAANVVHVETLFKWIAKQKDHGDKNWDLQVGGECAFLQCCVVGWLELASRSQRSTGFCVNCASHNINACSSDSLR